jgi:hypothetical protein
MVNLSHADTVAVGFGGYFLEPHEVTNAASTAATISASPMFALRGERPLGGNWRLEPHLGIVSPHASPEKTTSLTGFMNADFGYEVTHHLILSSGVGLHSTMLFTANGNALSWVLSNNFGAGYWLDDRVRLDLGTSVYRLFDSSTRKFRSFLEVAYAL